MGKYLLLLVAAGTLGGNYLLSSDVRSSGAAGRADATQTLASTVALELAYTGFNEAAQWLAAQTAKPASATTFSGTGAGGSYQVTITPVASVQRVTVVATGTVARSNAYSPNRALTSVTRTLESTFELGTGSGSGGATAAPEFMQAALTTGQMFTANGGVRIESGTAGINANVRTNSGAQSNGTNVIQGFLYHAQAITDAGIRSRLTANFTPASNPTGATVLQQTAAVTIPQYNASSHASYATAATTVNGNLLADQRFPSRTITLGASPSTPVFWYVSGDLTFQGAPFTIQGYGAFIVNGNVNFSTQTSVSGAEAGTSSVGFYTSGNINMNASSTLNGQFLTGQNVNICSTCTIYGSITTPGTVNFNSGGRIVHRTARASIMPMYPGVTTVAQRFRPLSLRTS
ncbi:MAG TPA: hypothetical protein VK610_06405 [Rhodothermales bacterium]|nr:hypothetical protein [Rhodothermales bacterium]